MKMFLTISLLTLALSTTVQASEKKNSGNFTISENTFEAMKDYMKEFGLTEDTINAMTNFMEQDDRSYGSMMNYLDRDNFQDMFDFMSSNFYSANNNEYNSNPSSRRGWYNMMGSNNGYNCHNYYR